ncbi:MAG: hypothetical protein R3F45_08040 [Gammaproteobacteria bacterium]
MSATQIALIAVVAALVGSMFVPRRLRHASRPTVDPSAPYGAKLAAAVADRLERGDALCYRHRDYCGAGARFDGSRYIYGEAYDGVVPGPDDLRATGTDPAGVEHLTFDTRAGFVSWLAAQSDESLDGKDLPSAWMRGNQRITRARLESFARGEPVPDV